MTGTGAGEVATICRCERAVLTAYRELRAAGLDDVTAFGSCAAIYRIHHPEASPEEARRLVAEWIDIRVFRGGEGPARGCARSWALDPPALSGATPLSG